MTGDANAARVWFAPPGAGQWVELGWTTEDGLNVDDTPVRAFDTTPPVVSFTVQAATFLNLLDVDGEVTR